MLAVLRRLVENLCWIVYDVILTILVVAIMCIFQIAYQFYLYPCVLCAFLSRAEDLFGLCIVTLGMSCCQRLFVAD